MIRTDNAGADAGPRVSRAAMLLGFAGLLPQFAAVTLIALGGQTIVLLIALAYPMIILSFLGGIWWGFAMRRRARQAGLATLAVVPSLVVLLLVIGLGLGIATSWILVANGVAILLTLPVDRHLARSGDAPVDWMRLRIPLSVGLGGLTIVAGYLAR